MKKELEKFYDECDNTIKDCAKASGVSIMDYFGDPDQAYLIASCIKIYNNGKQLSLDNAKEFEELKKTVEENNEMLKELLRKINENKKAKEKE